jgi:hypothetical protein
MIHKIRTKLKRKQIRAKKNRRFDTESFDFSEHYQAYVDPSNHSNSISDIFDAQTQNYAVIKFPKNGTMDAPSYGNFQHSRKVSVTGMNRSTMDIPE